MWADKQWADEQIRGAQTLEQLQKVAHLAASSISAGQWTWRVLLYIFMFSTIAMILFLRWSLFMMRRLEREKSSEQSG
jgi:hypothetical protein